MGRTSRREREREQLLDESKNQSRQGKLRVAFGQRVQKADLNDPKERARGRKLGAEYVRTENGDWVMTKPPHRRFLEHISTLSMVSRK